MPLDGSFGLGAEEEALGVTIASSYRCVGKDRSIHPCTIQWGEGVVDRHACWML